jgi:hypothetical protein
MEHSRLGRGERDSERVVGKPYTGWLLSLAAHLIPILYVHGTANLCWQAEGARSVWRLDPNLVVHSTTNPLFAAKISLSCLYGNVPKQKLDLLQFASSRVTKPGASPAQVVWQLGGARLLSEG